MWMGWSGSTTYLSKALRRILNHGNTRGLGAVDARLLPVQCGGGLAETHVCGPETLLLLPGAGSNAVTEPLLSSSPLSSLSSSVFRPHNGALCFVLFDQIFELPGSWFRSDRALLMLPSTPEAPVGWQKDFKKKSAAKKKKTVKSPQYPPLVGYISG